MKKFLSLLLAFTMIAGSMLVFSSCTPKPELDLDDAQDNLEDEDYYVVDNPEYIDVSYPYEEALVAYKDDNLLVITKYKDSKFAGMIYNQMNTEAKNKKADIEREIDIIEYVLKKYSNDCTSSEIDDFKEDLKELKSQLKEMDEYVIGRSGNIVWYGTKRAIKDSKG